MFFPRFIVLVILCLLSVPSNTWLAAQGSVTALPPSELGSIGQAARRQCRDRSFRVPSSLPAEVGIQALSVDNSMTTRDPLPNAGCVVPVRIPIFLSTDSTAWFWFTVSAAKKGDAIKAEWLDPSNILYTTTTWQPVESDGDWCFWGGIYVANRTPASRPGSWTVKLYFNDQLQNTLTFKIVYASEAPPPPTIDVIDRMMTRELAEEDCDLPVPAAAFQDSEPEIWFFFSLRDAKVGDVLTAHWFDPDGHLYQGVEWRAVEYNGDHCFFDALYVDGDEAADLEGSWTVKVFYNGAELFIQDFTILPNENWQNARVGYAVLNPEEGQLPAASLVFRLSQNGVLTSEVGVPASRATRSARIFADVNPPTVNTGAAIANPNDQAANVTLGLIGSTGANLGTANLTIPARGQVARFVNEFFSSVVAPFKGTLTISSNVPVAPMTLRLSVNSRGEALLTAIPVADLELPNETSANLPLVGISPNITTQVVLLNPTSQRLTGRLKFLAQNGSAFTVRINGVAGTEFPYDLQPNAITVWEATASSNLGVGSAMLQADSGQSAVPLATAIFRFFEEGVLITEAGVPAPRPTDNARILVDTTNNHNTGVALQNPSDSPILIHFILRPSDGSDAIRLGDHELAARGQISLYVGEIFPGLPVPFQGVLDITSGSRFCAVTLRQVINEVGNPLLTTVPLADLASPRTDALVIPHLAVGGGFDVEAILISSSGSSLPASMTAKGEMELYKQDGTVLLLSLDEVTGTSAISSLGKPEANPGSLLAIHGTNLGAKTKNSFPYVVSPTGAQLYDSTSRVDVQFSSDQSFLREVPAVDLEPHTARVSVPPLLDVKTGTASGGDVNVQVIRGSRVYGPSKRLTVKPIPVPVAPPGQFTVAMLDLFLAITEDLQSRIGGFSPTQDNASLLSTVVGASQQLRTLRNEIAALAANSSGTIAIGTTSGGLPLVLDRAGLDRLDQLFAAYLVGLGPNSPSSCSAANGFFDQFLKKPVLTGSSLPTDTWGAASSCGATGTMEISNRTVGYLAVSGTLLVAATAFTVGGPAVVPAVIVVSTLGVVASVLLAETHAVSLSEASESVAQNVQWGINQLNSQLQSVLQKAVKPLDDLHLSPALENLKKSAQSLSNKVGGFFKQGPPSGEIKVVVVPGNWTLGTGKTKRFQAEVTGTDYLMVSWKADRGTFSDYNLYTAPLIEGDDKVYATSLADPSKTGVAFVKVVKEVAVAVTPATVKLTPGGVQQFTATVTGTTSTQVTWGAERGTISPTGFYTAPSTEGNDGVYAYSVEDPSKWGKASVTVAKDLYFVLVGKGGTGTGLVTSIPDGINCGSKCSAGFSAGSVTLHAEPDTNCVFKGWSGACSGIGDCPLVMTSDRSVTATFDLAPSGKLVIGHPSLSFTMREDYSVDRPQGGLPADRPRADTSAKNTGTSPISYKITNVPSWLEISPTAPRTLQPGESVSLSVTPAFNLSKGTYSQTVQFRDVGTSALLASLPVTATVKGEMTLIIAVSAFGGATGKITSQPPGLNCVVTGTRWCGYSFPTGTTVALTATPDPGSVFRLFAAPYTSGTFQMTQSRMVEAIFSKPVTGWWAGTYTTNAIPYCPSQTGNWEARVSESADGQLTGYMWTTFEGDWLAIAGGHFDKTTGKFTWSTGSGDWRMDFKAVFSDPDVSGSFDGPKVCTQRSSGTFQGVRTK